MRFGLFKLFEALVVVFLVGIILVVTLPVLSPHRPPASAICRANLHQLGRGFAMYLEDNEGTFPPTEVGSNALDGLQTWVDLVVPERPELIRCPLAPTDPGIPARFNAGYCMNATLNTYVIGGDAGLVAAGRKLSEIRNPNRTVMVAECRASYVAFFGPATEARASLKPAAGRLRSASKDGARDGHRHAGGANYLFVDGHVKWHRHSVLAESGSARSSSGK